MGKESLEKRLGELEGRVGRLEQAIPEQAALIARIGASVSGLAQQANDLPGAVRTAIDDLWKNQIALEWKTNKLLHVLLPEEYPDPGSPPDNIRVEKGDQDGNQQATDSGPAAPHPEEDGEAAVPEVR